MPKTVAYPIKRPHTAIRRAALAQSENENHPSGNASVPPPSKLCQTGHQRKQLVARKQKRTGPHIYWRNDRAYADFRAYSDVGGTRGALCEPGSTWGTTDAEIAEALFAAQLSVLQEKRRGRIGTPQSKSTTLDVLVRDHLRKKHQAGLTSHSHMIDLEQRLRLALQFFGAKRDPRTIEPEEVRAWAEDLANGGTRTPGTVRHYLNALSGLYGRAQEGLYVSPKYNPVSMLQEKPTGSRKGEAVFFEVADAALVLEAARILETRESRQPGQPGNRVTGALGIHAIVATFLLTGGRKSEVLGLDLEEVSFDRKEIRFRPNDHRGLKTSTSTRTVPLWPQLESILREWVFGGDQPRTEGLLFPSLTGGMIGDLRKSLDRIGELCELEQGAVRTRAFRHTYCSARLQTVQRILKPGREPTDPEAWEYVEVSKFQVQKEMGHGGAQLVNRIYGHAQRNPHRSDVVEYRVERHEDTLGDRLRSIKAFAQR